MKQFKSESKKVLDLMINSIYTNKEIFLRELLSNASDAIDKLYYKSLQLGTTGLSRSDFAITITVDNENRTLTVSDNGIGMDAKELENNLGTIAKSGSQDFKSKNDLKEEDINIIGQFGVGFYSGFMVSDSIEVISKPYGQEIANKWHSNGAEGYEIEECVKVGQGTDVVLHLKNDEEYNKFLEEYTLKSLVKKYSNYISYPIKMLCTKYNYDVAEDAEPEKTTQLETLNSMVPLWKKNKSEITDEEYNTLFKEMFFESENPFARLHFSVEGLVDFKALLYIPAKAPYNYYSKEYEKGLKLYTNGVMITEKCKDLLPDYFSFVKGIVDTDIQLNLSRETVQQSKSLKTIATNIEKKIKQELEKMLAEKREDYEKFFKSFGLQLKFGIYSSYGMNKELLQDLLLYYSVKQDKMITLQEYINSMCEDQKFIYYATSNSIESIKLMPQLDKVIEKGYDVLCMTDDVDEFALRFISEYKEKAFKSVSGGDLGIDDEEFVESDLELAALIRESLGDKVEKVRISNRIKNHPVCFTTEGEISLEMEKVLNSMRGNEMPIKAKRVLEINCESELCKKLRLVNSAQPEEIKTYAEVIFGLAEIIEGICSDKPTELVDKICNLISK
ncbi:MAG: molecular chaperone HtpG [Clostridia bacterium]|nr:molecular chaperone HtpG [Clostridia bacterium]